MPKLISPEVSATLELLDTGTKKLLNADRLLLQGLQIAFKGFRDPSYTQVPLFGDDFITLAPDSDLNARIYQQQMAHVIYECNTPVIAFVETIDKRQSGKELRLVVVNVHTPRNTVKYLGYDGSICDIKNFLENGFGGLELTHYLDYVEENPENRHGITIVKSKGIYTLSPGMVQ